MASTSRAGKRESRTPVIEGGIVKGISSGSTIQILRVSPADKSSGSRGPTEYEISLQGIRAPLGGGKDRAEEPFYFQSREFLRSKLIGAQVAFNITHSGDGSRRFGHVFTLDGEDIRETIVANGWAEVKPQPASEKNEQKLKAHSRLLELQSQAKEAHRGIWSKSGNNKGLRSVISKFDVVDLFEKLKGKHTAAIVEQVRSGSTLRVYLPGTGHSFSLLLSGVQSPILKAHLSDEQQLAWARAARFFSELQVLHRDVEIVLESLDKSNNFYGTVLCTGQNLGLKLLENGLGRFVEWSAAKTSNVEAMKKAEKSAQTAGLRLWSAGNSKSSSSSNTSSGAPTAPGKRVEFWATVVDILNAGSIQVVEHKDGQKGALLGDEHRVNFSSLQAARFVPREKLKKETQVSKQEILAGYEARNMLRKKLIGQKVRLVLDYTRDANKEHDMPERSFYSVYHEKKNVGLDLVALGFAHVTEHKESDARSPDYQDFILAESKAKKRNLGIHAKNAGDIPAFNDLTEKESLTKEARKEAASKKDEAKEAGDANGKDARSNIRDGVDAAQVARLNQFLTHVQGTRMPCVVERVFNATRFKVWVDKIQCMLPITLSCVRSEKMEALPDVSPPSYPASRCVGNQAYHHVKNMVYLRDVDILIDGVDRTGAFSATMWIGGKDLSANLIQDGLVKLLHAGAKRNKNIPYEDYRKFEDLAKAARRGVWLNWDEAEEERRIQEIRAKRRAEEQGASAVDRKGKIETFKVRVTEIIDGSRFFYQRVDNEEDAVALDKIMAELQTASQPISSPITEGQLVAAQFSVDQTWYRARVVKAEADDNYHVYYVDYGNHEILPKSSLKQLPASCQLTQLAAQAQEAVLAFIRCPTLEEDFGPEAADCLKDLVWDKPILASLQSMDNNIAHVALGDPSVPLDVNGELLRQGYARVPRIRFAGRNPVISKMREFEEAARTARLGIWQYGDIIDSDEE